MYEMCKLSDGIDNAAFDIRTGVPGRHITVLKTLFLPQKKFLYCVLKMETECQNMKWHMPGCVQE